MTAIEYSPNQSLEDSHAHIRDRSRDIPQKDGFDVAKAAEIGLYLRRLRALGAMRFAAPRRLYPQSRPDRSRRDTGQTFAPVYVLTARAKLECLQQRAYRNWHENVPIRRGGWPITTKQNFAD
jgi:hypothetical protein